MLDHELENVMFTLQQVYDVLSSRKISENAARKWREFFYEFEFTDAQQALNEWLRKERNAPKPSDIEELIKVYKTKRGEIKKKFYAGNCPLTKKALEGEERKPPLADDRVKAAWCIYHRLVHGDFLALQNSALKPEVEMTKSEALEIVNEQAAKYGYPDAIEDKYKIAYYWQAQEQAI